MQGVMLPQVDRTFSGTSRFILLIAGIALLGWSLLELWRGPWQSDVLALTSLAVVVAAAVAAMLLVVAASMGGSRERWQYAEKVLVIHRRTWGRDGEIRLTAANVASITVLHLRDDEMFDRWRVVVRPREGVTSRWNGPDRVIGFETDDLPSLDQAKAVRRGLLAHLGMTDRR